METKESVAGQGNEGRVGGGGGEVGGGTVSLQDPRPGGEGDHTKV